MKSLLICIVGLFPCSAAFAQQISLAFPEREIDLPSLSLRESVRQNNLPVAPFTPKAWNVNQPRPKVSADKFVFAPSDDVDDKLLIKEPDLSIDYRLIVKDAKIASKK